MPAVASALTYMLGVRYEMLWASTVMPCPAGSAVTLQDESARVPITEASRYRSRYWCSSALLTVRTVAALSSSSVTWRSSSTVFLCSSERSSPSVTQGVPSAKTAIGPASASTAAMSAVKIAVIFFFIYIPFLPAENKNLPHRERYCNTNV